LFSFGIGSCDQKLIKETASNGNGLSYIVSFDQLEHLKGKVVEAIEKSLEPIMHDCKFRFGVDT